MKRHAVIACAALSLAASGAWAAAEGPGGDVNAPPSAAPKTPGKADSQQDAEAAFERARAECRRVDKKGRRDCVRLAQREYDKTQRVAKPLRKPAPEQGPKP